MMDDVLLFSNETPPSDWSGAVSMKPVYGPKGALLATLPRPWTLPFVLVPASVIQPRNSKKPLPLSASLIGRIRGLADAGQIIVRSSVVGESIWDRGRYVSIVVSAQNAASFEDVLQDSVRQVLSSCSGKESGLVIQRHVVARSRGEFGNLLRISKTRDHWELSTTTVEGTTSRIRFNTQRDEAALSNGPLTIRARVARQRLFGSVAAWFNNVLVRGTPQRLNCEWVMDAQSLFIVQVDEEDEDFLGVNPFQIAVPPAYRPASGKGILLSHADSTAMQEWDKLKVLDELWESNVHQRPMLFYVPLTQLCAQRSTNIERRLAADFQSLLGPDNIVVRTSVRAGEKPPNLPRTECLRPPDAARWCMAQLEKFDNQGQELTNLAFVAHRFIAARSSAWARAEPDGAVVEIHSLWGLPDALQYCPYDIWDVHLRTELATDYPEYKSHMLIPREDGGWEYVRVKNEFGRSLSIGRRDAMDIAVRTASIAKRIGAACHVMWFVGCVDSDGTPYNIPWYWIGAHEAHKNVDRSNYRVLTITDLKSLEAFRSFTGSRWRQAVELRPEDRDLMRDTHFVESVGATAREMGVPVLLAGSDLAHAYYQLSRQGCMVVPLGEREHSRVRQTANFGKLVRDKIPERIAQRQEAEVTKAVPNELRKGFLIGKLVEEAMEVRGADSVDQKRIELGDLLEVVRALIAAEGLSFNDVVSEADEKKRKAGGFERGLVLLQTGILSGDRAAIKDQGQPITQVLARKISNSSYEIPFSFFGFMEFDQERTAVFEDFGVRLVVRLKSDRIEVQLAKEAEQLELPLDLDLAIGSDEELDALHLSAESQNKTGRKRRSPSRKR